MKWDIKVITDRGSVRETNEDGFYINGVKCPNVEFCRLDTRLEGKYLCVLIDGVGGCAHGEVATKLAIEKIDNLAVPETEDEILVFLNELNKEICDAAEKVETACTIAGMCSIEDRCYWFNTGDSRVYEISHGYLNQLSTDDTASGISGDLAEEKEPLLQYLGKRNIIPHIGTARSNSKYLICTDGLTDMITLDEIEDIIASANEDDLKESLLNAAKQAGGKDNITIAVVSPVLEE